MKKRRKQTILALFCMILALICGCGSGAKSTEAYAVAETAAAAEMYEEESAMDGGFYAGGGNMAAAAKAPAAAIPADEAVEAAVEESGTTSGTAGGNSTDVQSELPAQRKLIRTVDMYVETDNFDPLLTSIRERVTALDGYIERSDISGQRTNHQGEPYPRSAYFTIRIPSTKLDTFTALVEEGANVINKSENTRDVTLQYSDIKSRKKSLTIEQDRIWALLEKADSLESVIALEERLSEIRYELESMESQLRLYDNQVDYSTVELSIDEVKVYTPTAPETIGERIRNGFAKSLQNVSDFCVNLFVGLITSSPIWVPLLVLTLLVLGILKRRAWKKRLRWNAANQGIENMRADSSGKD